MKQRNVRWSLLSTLCAGLMACVPGEMQPDGGSSDLCGSRGLGECDKGEYCNFPEKAECGTFDAPGVCAAVPQSCTKEYRPVCGCDGETYSNACMAAAAGVSVRAKGACPAQPDPGPGGGVGAFCGGLLGARCAKALYCAYTPDAICGAADQSGTCASRPEVCTALYDPVCGCDGKTYGNACSAASLGAAVLHDGECKTP